jgi:hypothetical protein
MRVRRSRLELWPVPEIVLSGRAADDQSYPQVDEGEEEHWHQKEEDEGDLVDGEPLDTEKGYCVLYVF